MTTATAKLHPIQTGDASADEAMKALREVVKAHGVGGVNAIRTALRGWTWKAMQTRRADAELREWYRVIRTVSSLLEKVDGRAAAYVEALAHLVEESVRYAEARPRADLLERAHVVTLLEHVATVGGRTERARLAEEVDVSSSRLSQILTELTVAGALERSASGRQTAYELTPMGRALLAEARTKARLRSSQSVTVTPPPAPKPVTIDASDAAIGRHAAALAKFMLRSRTLRSEPHKGAGLRIPLPSDLKIGLGETSVKRIAFDDVWSSSMVHRKTTRITPEELFGASVTLPAFVQIDASSDVDDPLLPELQVKPFPFNEPVIEDLTVAA